MTETDRMNSKMAELMPLIRKAFKQGTEKHKLSDVLRVELSESALNVRLPDPKWPAASDALVAPAGTPVTALRLFREVEIKPLKGTPKPPEETLSEFAEETTAAYVNAVVAQVIASIAQPYDNTEPDAQVLHKQAIALGPPCRVLVGADLYSTLEGTSDALVNEVQSAPWEGRRTLVLPLTLKGPWVEELDPEFIIDWESGAAGWVKVQASRRLYLHNAGEAHLYDP